MLRTFGKKQEEVTQSKHESKDGKPDEAKDSKPDVAAGAPAVGRGVDEEAPLSTLVPAAKADGALAPAAGSGSKRGSGAIAKASEGKEKKAKKVAQEIEGASGKEKKQKIGDKEKMEADAAVSEAELAQELLAADGL